MIIKIIIKLIIILKLIIIKIIIVKLIIKIIIVKLLIIIIINTNTTTQYPLFLGIKLTYFFFNLEKIRTNQYQYFLLKNLYTKITKITSKVDVPVPK